MITLFLDMVETHGRSHRLLNLLVELILPPVRDDFLPSMRSKPYLPTPYSITMCRFRTIAHGPQILHSIQGPQRTPRCQSCSEKDVLETGVLVLRLTMQTSLLSSIYSTVARAIIISNYLFLELRSCGRYLCSYRRYMYCTGLYKVMYQPCKGPGENGK